MNQVLYIPTQQQFLSFALSREQWALLSTVQLIEILQVDFSSITEIPGMPAAVMGVYPTAPELLWVVDLALLSGLNSRKISRQYSILKVKSQWGNLGYIVERVGNLITIESNTIKTISSSVTESSTTTALPNTWQQGVWNHPQGKTLPILNTDAIALGLRSSAL
ncbi:MAG: chemotaxis protein CheW [Microcoleaceae cyanobacterium]